MKSHRKRRIRWVLAVLLCVTLAGFAIVRSELFQSVVRLGLSPQRVAFVAIKGEGKKKLEIHDNVVISLLLSIIEGGETVDLQAPAHPDFELFIPPAGSSDFSYPPSPAWRTAEGNFVWQHNGRTSQLNGNLADFVDWMKIRRINQLLRNPDPTQRQLGEELRGASLKEHIATLLRIANSANHVFAQHGIRDIAEFVMVEPAIMDQYVPGDIYVPRSRVVADPNRRLRSELFAIVTRVQNSPLVATGKEYGTGRAAVQCLQQVGDRATADALVELLEQQERGLLTESILATIEQLYGIPALYQRSGMCGNSSAEEFARFAKTETKRQDTAIDDIMTWRRIHLDDAEEEFYDSVVLRWSDELIELAKISRIQTSYGDRTPARELATLIRLGKPVVAALQRRQQSASDWQETATLEFCIAALTGECDGDLVAELLAGGAARQRMACNIIAVAADGTWNDELDALLRTPYPSGSNLDAVVLREAAAQALYHSGVGEALHKFEAALNEGFESHMMLQILQRFEVPAADIY